MAASSSDFRGIVGLEAIDRLRRTVEARGKIDYTPLMRIWQKILVEGNERGLLAGLDAFDRPMPPTRRERDASLSRRRGGGPPLAPRGRASRAIRNFRATFGRDARGNWFVSGRWDGFTSRGGGSIPDYHANPRGAPYPRRDIVSQIRPTERRRMEQELRAFLEAELRRIRGA